MVSPVVPATTGNGLAMRAGMTVRALARDFRVRVLVAERYPSVTGALKPELAALCDQIIVLKGSGDIRPQIAAADIEPDIDVVHFFRLSTAPHRDVLQFPGSKHFLDLDDIESVSRPRIAQIYRDRGRKREAAFEERMAANAEQEEIDALLTFERVYVASTVDTERLPICGSAEVRVLPNVVDVVRKKERHTGRNGLPFTFLFAGTLTYFPNEDGVIWFAEEVIPRLKSMSDSPFRVLIAGHASSAVRSLSAVPEVEVLGWVVDLAAVYARGDAAIIPLRAGGGTRIKLLEAAAYGLPVVSTSIGAEGIDVEGGTHCLIADDAADFAAACETLISQPGVGLRLAARAKDLVEERYTINAMIEAMAID